MSTTEIVNLRAEGTDPSDPGSGQLVGTATLTMPDDRYPDDEPKLLATELDRYTYLRLFRFVRGTFSYGGKVTAEYVEITPTAITLVKP